MVGFILWRWWQNLESPIIWTKYCSRLLIPVNSSNKIFNSKCFFTERIEQGKIAELILPKTIKDYLEYKDSAVADVGDGADGADGADVGDGPDNSADDGADGAEGADGSDVADNWIESQDPKN